MSIFAGTGGFLDDVPLVDVKRFQESLLTFVESHDPEVMRTIAEKSELPEEISKNLETAIKEFRATFVPSVGGPLKEARAEPLTDEEQERVKRFRRPTPEEFEKKAGHAGDTPVQLPG